MHTVIVLFISFVVLGACHIAARKMTASSAAANRLATIIFLPLWLLGAGINMWMGVSGAGYSVEEELPMFGLVFGLPAAIALFIRWKLS
ncbi:hypothetical protein [Undibacterium terreum]|uniref:Uncharacterized protein n=1 Tax=Undibacterium terreum TaxID=1224302 RepID=A0A916U5Z3_9BURK|nr:hypothetical protein [Undibacterium terreum]GGC60423.1 hypothetical protein GCM10011396_04110 [Undibacterium terreum]